MPALGFTYTQGRPCPSFAMLHFGTSNPPFTATSSPEAREAMASVLAVFALPKVFELIRLACFLVPPFAS